MSAIQSHKTIEISVPNTIQENMVMKICDLLSEPKAQEAFEDFLLGLHVNNCSKKQEDFISASEFLNTYKHVSS